MKYLISRDAKESEKMPICLWYEGAELYEDDEQWCSKDPTSLIDEMTIEDFEAKYGPCTINPGEAREANIVVHWIDK